MRRSNLEMYVSILEACSQPLLLTQVMYKANVNCSVLKNIITILIAKGLLDVVYPRSNLKPYYIVNSNGRKLASTLRMIEQILFSDIQIIKKAASNSSKITEGE
jgi:predicted transcriptional regulator